jgi:hypothetical protein
MYRIGGVFRRTVGFVIDEVVFRHHFDVGVFDVDGNWPPKSNGNRSIAGEQRPPDAFPESLVGPAELRSFNATILLA